ncbi:uncharacterized protein LOC126760394 [Bactrocera neohumeralis]|uniref:uncharacterized protein LOC126760394 n=1 Tax=Bactrocera neohumeralis TaxID=98809 RepID=UPI002165B0B0|nr:uncharacterized protein LOC126760394 [Bactrocera neohumeralis]
MNMANCCKDCDRLQPRSSGSAPVRPEFQQPTMYDHFQNFQRFKMQKQEAQAIEKRKEELLKMNTNFTNWNPSCSKEMFDQFSTQDVALFRQQIRLAQNGERSILESLTAPTEGGASSIGGTATVAGTGTGTGTSVGDKSLKKKDSLLTISRTPVQCPIGACGRTIGVTSVLSHYLRDHSEDFGVQCQEIYGGKRSVLIFDATTLDFRDNVCLGVLAYGGIKEKCSDPPAQRGICIHNAFLPKPHEHLDAHLPILIMACRTSWSAMLKDKQLETRITKPEDSNQHLLVIWLVSVQSTKPIHCTLTAYDRTMTSSRSVIAQVRQLNESQNPSEFLVNDANSLRLSNGEINILSHDGNDCVHLEVMINEYDQ